MQWDCAPIATPQVWVHHTSHRIQAPWWPDAPAREARGVSSKHSHLCGGLHAEGVLRDPGGRVALDYNHSVSTSRDGGNARGNELLGGFDSETMGAGRSALVQNAKLRPPAPAVRRRYSDGWPRCSSISEAWRSVLQTLRHLESLHGRRAASWPVPRAPEDSHPAKHKLNC